MAGDSCHPILPYMAQGANSAFEDAAVIGAVLSKVSSRDQLPEATRIYEEVRQARTRKLREIVSQQGKDFHLHDGPEQLARDKMLAQSFGSDFGPRGRW